MFTDVHCFGLDAGNSEMQSVAADDMRVVSSQRETSQASHSTGYAEGRSGL